MNRVILMGRLTRDPDVRYSQGGEGSMAVARYTLAVDRRRTRSNESSNEQTADFISCVAFARSAEFAEKYLHQGTKVVDVVVDDQEFAESKASAASSEAAYTPSRSNPAAPAGDGFMNIPDGVEDEGLPFN